MTDSNATHPRQSSIYRTTRAITIDPEVMRENRIIMGLYKDPRADIFRVLRTNILKQLRENEWNNLAVTSTSPGAGKTFVALNLAIAIALEGNQSVLLIDADLRRPNIGRMLNIQPTAGLADYLNGSVDLQDTLVTPGIEGLVILPGKESNGNWSEMLSSPRMAHMVEETRSRYDSRIIIYDIPPIFVADDALLFMSYVDSALLVVEDGRSTADELQHAMTMLEQTNLLGIVLNKARRGPLRYHYGYIDPTSG